MPEAIRLPGYSATYTANMSTATATRTIAGITVPSSPLINAAFDFARTQSENSSYNHAVRCWLLGTAIADRIPGLGNRDREVHSVAAILHDIGGGRDQGPACAGKDVGIDSANAALAFLERQSIPSEWNADRKQLLWNSIALHTPTTTQPKQPEIVATLLGIVTDFSGPSGVPGNVLSIAEWQNIAIEFPRSGLRDGSVQRMCAFCRNKPQSVYITLAGEFGEAFAKGHQCYDYITNPVDPA